MTILEFHPLANLFPLIEGAEFDALVESIKANGLLEEIVLLDGKILDGRNRYRAGLAAGLFSEADEPATRWEFVQFSDQDVDGVFGSETVDRGPLAWVLAKNLERRHLTDGQRAMIASDLATMKQGERTDLEPSANLRKVDQATAAETLHVSPRSVTSANRVKETGTPELVKAARQGKIAVSVAEKAATLPPDQQNQVVAEALAGKANAARTVMKKAARAEKEIALATKQRALPDRKFGVILTDDEWQYQVYSRDTGLDRSPDNHYPTSTIEQLKARPVGDLAAKDAVYWMWAPPCFLAIAIELMAHRGFTYKSQIVWIKERVGDCHGTGHWFWGDHEILLVGTRGDIPAPAPGSQWSSYIVAPCPKIEGTNRARHSAKPEIFYELIEAYFPNLPKIELNARAGRAGWESWGNEAPIAEGQDIYPDEFNQEPREPSDLEMLQDGEASSEAGPQAEASLAGTGSETLAGHEGDSAATTAAADESGGGSVVSRMQEEASRLFDKRPRWQGSVDAPAAAAEPIDLAKAMPAFLRRASPRAAGDA